MGSGFVPRRPAGSGWLWRFALVVGPALALVGPGCGSSRPGAPPGEPEGPVWFADVTEQVGLDFTHDAGPIPTDRYFLPQIIGSGVALFDFDGDGRLDLYLVQNGGPGSGSTNRLFRQGPDGRFADVSRGSGLDVTGYGMGAAAGDVDNDGRPDLVLTEYGRLRLFLNRGGGKFAEATGEAGLHDPLWGTSAGFLDYDRDGWLDLVVVHYVQFDAGRVCGGPARDPDYCHPKSFPGAVTRLYRNRGIPPPGRAVRFEEVTVPAGLSQAPGPGLGVLCADFDGDGWVDIFVANDAQANRLWVNRRDGTFRDEAILRGVAYNGNGQAQGNMGVAWGDVDGDGRPDLFVTHLSEELHTLWRQDGPGRFRDATAAAGLGRRAGTGFGTGLADFDHDGALDLAVVNGRVSRRGSATRADRADFWGAYAEPNQLFANDGRGVFRDVSAANRPFCGRPGVARGLAVGDLDGDGGLDLVTTAVAAPARVYRNVCPGRGHWLMVRAVEPALGGRDAYGAVVVARAGERRWERPINPGYSYLCSNDPRAHFGLGAAGRVDALDVTWPDGTGESFPGTDADRLVVLRRGDGRRRP